MSEKLVKLWCSKHNRKTANGRSFVTYSTKVNIVVKGEEEKGKQQKSVDLRFTKKSGVDLNTLKRGIITARADCIGMPAVYEITEDENGKHYPEVWLRDNAFVSFKHVPFVPDTDFVVDESEEDEDL